ncbi:11078_t:CDS:1, partial [Funneliformis caledonium]
EFQFSASIIGFDLLLLLSSKSSASSSSPIYLLKSVSYISLGYSVYAQPDASSGG